MTLLTLVLVLAPVLVLVSVLVPVLVPVPVPVLGRLLMPQGTLSKCLATRARAGVLLLSRA